MFGFSVPVWIFATAFGIVVTLLVREILILLRLHRSIPLPTLFYSAMALILAILANWYWIGGYR